MQYTCAEAALFCRGSLCESCRGSDLAVMMALSMGKSMETTGENGGLVDISMV